MADHASTPATGKPSSGLTRRAFGRLAVGAALTPILASRVARAGHHEAGEAAAGEAPTLVTDVESNALLLSQVKYVAKTELEGKQCSNCALMLQRDGDYGKCGLFQQGKVHATGWCTSWIQKPGT